MIATNSAPLVPTYWAFFESFKYWGAMRKRAALGLGDPIVTNRFLPRLVIASAIGVCFSVLGHVVAVAGPRTLFAHPGDVSTAGMTTVLVTIALVIAIRA